MSAHFLAGCLTIQCCCHFASMINIIIRILPGCLHERCHRVFWSSLEMLCLRSLFYHCLFWSCLIEWAFSKKKYKKSFTLFMMSLMFNSTLKPDSDKKLKDWYFITCRFKKARQLIFRWRRIFCPNVEKIVGCYNWKVSAWWWKCKNLERVLPPLGRPPTLNNNGSFQPQLLNNTWKLFGNDNRWWAPKHMYETTGC